MKKFATVLSVCLLTGCASAPTETSRLRDAELANKNSNQSKDEQALGAYQIGVAARGKGLLGMSRENLDRAVELAPDSQTARDATDYKITHLPLKPVSVEIEEKCAHAHNLLVEGNLDEAAVQFKQISTEAPEFEFPYIYMGVIEVKRGNRSGAKELFKQALQINPKNSNATGWLSKIEAKDKPQAEVKPAVNLESSH